MNEKENGVKQCVWWKDTQVIRTCLFPSPAKKVPVNSKAVQLKFTDSTLAPARSALLTISTEPPAAESPITPLPLRTMWLSLDQRRPSQPFIVDHTYSEPSPYLAHKLRLKISVCLDVNPE